MRPLEAIETEIRAAEARVEALRQEAEAAALSDVVAQDAGWRKTRKSAVNGLVLAQGSLRDDAGGGKTYRIAAFFGLEKPTRLDVSIDPDDGRADEVATRLIDAVADAVRTFRLAPFQGATGVGAGGTRPLTPAEIEEASARGVTTFHELFQLWRSVQNGAASKTKGPSLFGVGANTFAAWSAGTKFPVQRVRETIVAVTGIACVRTEGAARDAARIAKLQAGYAAKMEAECAL